MSDETILRPLTLDATARTQLSDLKAWADANPMGEQAMKARATAFSNGEPLDPLPQFVADLDGGWNAFYVIEDHGIVQLRRLRVTIDTPGKLPSDDAMKIFAEIFGFITPFEKCIAFPEELEDGLRGFNVMEPLDGDMERFAVKMSRVAR